jgi:hypothetical protein
MGNSGCRQPPEHAMPARILLIDDDAHLARIIHEGAR